MHYNTTTAIPFRINGSKELKRYIAGVNEIAEQIKYQFERTKTELNASRKVSKVAFAENLLFECLNQLERFRKMLVNNKQQRKTMHYQNRLFIRDVRATASFSECVAGFVMEDKDSACIERLMQMDAALKQHHRTVSRKILEDVNTIVIAIRNRHIIAYQNAVEQM